MKRRELFKMLATLAAVPFVAPMMAMCKPKRNISDLSMVEYENVCTAIAKLRHVSNDDLFGDDHYFLEQSGQLGEAVSDGFNKWNKDTLPESNILTFHLLPLSIGTEVPRDFYGRGKWGMPETWEWSQESFTEGRS